MATYSAKAQLRTFFNSYFVTSMKSILIATIGTRDLSFKIASGNWYNIGDDRMQNGDIIGEQAEVIADLSLSDSNFRTITKYLVDRLTIYSDRILPVIIGKLLLEHASDIEKVYLIATDQKAEVREREKDTVYSAQLIKQWIIHKFKHLSESDIEIITLGDDGTNPSNFEEMFQWWRRTWRDKIKVASSQPIWVCLKGGVGQASEASRISGLSLFSDRILFFEFRQNPKANLIGVPSDYTGPFLGTNYLWDKTQQQTLNLLRRYDYAEAYDLLKPYLMKESSKFGALPNLLKAGMNWNQGQFDKFYSLAKSSMSIPAASNFWWMAYEQAYLAVVRLEQQNTTEALFHSFRAVEGLVGEFVRSKYEAQIKYSNSSQPNTPYIDGSNLPSHLREWFDNHKHRAYGNVGLYGKALFELLKLSFTGDVWAKNIEIKTFVHSTIDERNSIFHSLGGLEEKQLYQAWGKDVTNREQWEKQVLSCLNFVSGQSFRSLADGSMFAKLHNSVVTKLESVD
jgi:hypothetical protein